MKRTMFREFPAQTLPFPSRDLRVCGGVVKEYVIPKAHKEEILRSLYPFERVPGLDDEMYDLHEGRRFRVRDYKVVVECGMLKLVSPYYATSGGSVIDWMPAPHRKKDTVWVM